MKEFPIPHSTAVVTTSYVTVERLPILKVSHERDEEGVSLWQFHCANGDYSSERLQLVRLDTLIALDPTLREIADLPSGAVATRSSAKDAWRIATDGRRG
jgi:hypothetical protein